MMNNGNYKPISTLELAQALFIINKHAKTAPDPLYLYELKRKAINKLIREKKTKKVGLHFSPNPKNSQQRLDCLVQIDQYYFHIPPKKEDVQTLPHLGEREQTYRNPQAKLSLFKAKKMIEGYLGIKHIKKENKLKTKRANTNFSDHLFLGKR
jgi:hypothetical protein